MITRDTIIASLDPILTSLPQGAVQVDEQDDGDRRILTFKPRATGAASVSIDYRDYELYAFIASDSPIEIAAPLNTNYGPPNAPWQEDLADLVGAVATGDVTVGYGADDSVLAVSIGRTRLGVNLHLFDRVSRVEQPSAWT